MKLKEMDIDTLKFKQFKEINQIAIELSDGQTFFIMEENGGMSVYVSEGSLWIRPQVSNVVTITNPKLQKR